MRISGVIFYLAIGFFLFLLAHVSEAAAPKSKAGQAMKKVLNARKFGGNPMADPEKLKAAASKKAASAQKEAAEKSDEALKGAKKALGSN